MAGERLNSPLGLHLERMRIASLPTGGPALFMCVLFSITERGCPVLALQGWAAMLPMAFASNYAGVKARVPLCDQPATHPSRKAREGWGTHCVIVQRKAGPPTIGDDEVRSVETQLRYVSTVL